MMAEASGRTIPNVLITGTPGTGKSSTCALVAEASGLAHLDVNSLVKTQSLHSGWDEKFQSFILDEDKVQCSVFWHIV